MNNSYPASIDQARRAEANARALRRMTAAEPVLIDVAPAIDALPGMRPDTILVSGAPLPWQSYRGGQRRGIIGAALFEGLAADEADAEERLRDGRIRIGGCHDHGCVGSVTGVTSASMPVLVVRDAVSGSRGHCILYEGSSRRRLTYGLWGAEIRDNLIRIRDRIAPALGAAIRHAGGIRLDPIIRHGLQMGDELHSRNTAATLLLQRALLPGLIAAVPSDRLLEVVDYLGSSDLFFLHVGMAAGKAIADAATGIEDSSLVTAMAASEHEFAIRVSGTGDTWFRAEIPPIQAGFFDGYGPEDAAYMGGESLIMETVGLGAMAAAAAPALQRFSAGSAAAMATLTEQMGQLTLGRHPRWLIPAADYAGTPVGIDCDQVVRTGRHPVMHMGVAHRDGGQIGAGLLTAPRAPFVAASAELARRNSATSPHPVATPTDASTTREEECDEHACGR